MMEQHKVCPLAAANPEQQNSTCLGEACACYVKMHKPRPLQASNFTISADPEFYYRYRGCGLITHIPWELAKREDQPKTTRQKEVP